MSRFLSILPQGLFYGNIYRESEIGGYEERDDTLVVDSSYFYLTSNAEGKPLLSFIESSVSSPPGGNDTEIQYNSNGAFAGDSNFVWNATTRGIQIIPNTGVHTDVAYGNTDGTMGLGFQSNVAPTIYKDSINVIEFFDDSLLPKFPIWHKDGTASDPPYSFESDLNTGIFRPGTDKLGFTAGAKEMIRLTEQSVGHDFVSVEDRLGVNLGIGVVPKSTLHVQGDGFFENGKVVAAGFYTPDGDAAVVVFRESDGSTVMRNGQLNLDSDHFYLMGSSDGKPLLSLTETQTFQKIIIESPPNDSNTTPPITFAGATSTGIRNPVSNALRFVADGVASLDITNTSVVSNVRMGTIAGSEASPGYSFGAADADTGLFRPNVDEIGFTLGGVRRGILSHDKFSVSGGFYSDSFGEPTYKLIFKESEAGGYSKIISNTSVVFDSNFFYLTSDGSGNTIISSSSNIQKDIILESPTASEDATFFHTSRALTINAVKSVLVGSSTPSITVTIRSNSDRSAAGTANVSSQAVTSTTTEQLLPINSSSIAAGSWVWIETTALSGSVDSLSISMEME